MNQKLFMKQLKAAIAKGGSTAQKLMNMKMNTEVLRSNNTLRKDEWKHFDTAIVKIARERLVGIARLRAKGLVYTIGNGLGKTVLEYEDASDVEDAQVSMDGVTRGRNDRMEYDINYLPLPITHGDYQIGIRALNASRELGETLDTSMAEAKTRKIAEKLETYMFQGSSTFTYGGGSIYGLMDAPNRNTGNLTANWDDSAATGTTIRDDVLAMKQANLDAMHYGPYDLWVPGNFEIALDEDYVTGYPKTIRTRLSEINGIDFIGVADKLTNDNVILVEMASDTIRYVEGLPLTNLEWDTEGGMVFNYKIMTIGVTQVRADQDGNSGIAHWS